MRRSATSAIWPRRRPTTLARARRSSASVSATSGISVSAICRWRPGLPSFGAEPESPAHARQHAGGLLLRTCAATRASVHRGREQWRFAQDFDNHLKMNVDPSSMGEKATGIAGRGGDIRRERAQAAAEQRRARAARARRDPIRPAASRQQAAPRAVLIALPAAPRRRRQSSTRRLRPCSEWALTRRR